VFLMSMCGRLLVLGVNPFTGAHCTGFVHGDCLWDLSLGHRTGDGKFDVETFRVGCAGFFLLGGGEGEEENPGHVTEQWVW
jgi:hypothetical protein